MIVRMSFTYSTHPEVPEDTSCHSSHHTSILYLRWSCVAMHLRELQLRLRPDPLW